MKGTDPSAARRIKAKAVPVEDKGSRPARIRGAALKLFNARGYHGTSMRELAQAVRIEAASLYYHYPSKQDILFDLFEQTMDALLQGLADAIANGGTPGQRLREVVRFHVMFHIARQDEAFLSHSELRSLSPANQSRNIAKRDRYEKMLRALLAEGVATGEFDIPDIPTTSTGILVMCSGVSDWFEPKGRLTATEVAERYGDMVMRLVGCAKSVGPVDAQASARVGTKAGTNTGTKIGTKAGVKAGRKAGKKAGTKAVKSASRGR